MLLVKSSQFILPTSSLSRRSQTYVPSNNKREGLGQQNIRFPWNFLLSLDLTLTFWGPKSFQLSCKVLKTPARFSTIYKSNPLGGVLPKVVPLYDWSINPALWYQFSASYTMILFCLNFKLSKPNLSCNPAERQEYRHATLVQRTTIGGLHRVKNQAL